jgi:hydrogenase maturation factor
VTCGEGHCITCSDEGIEMTVLRATGADGLAACRDAGGEDAEIDVALVEAVRPGDVVLVHAGVAIALLDGSAVAP